MASSDIDKDALQVTFEIDPSVSQVQDEHVKLAEYMKDRLLSIDVYDADTRFMFATTKIPLHELLR